MLKRIKLMALVSAAAVFVLVLFYLLSQKSPDAVQSASSEGVVAAVVAKQDIKPFTVLTGEMLEEKSFRKGDAPPNAVEKLEDAVGKVSLTELFQGEALTRARVGAANNLSVGLAGRLENKMRGITIQVDAKHGLSGNLRIGNYVDIIAVYKADGMAGETLNRVGNAENTQIVWDNIGGTFSFTAMQKIKVAALDSKFVKSGTEGTGGETYSNVTLEVTPEQAAQIALIDDGGGTIRLSLRPQQDELVIRDPRQNLLRPYTG